MSDDARDNRRGWLISIGLLVLAMAILFGFFELRIRYADADATDGYAMVGDQLLVVDRLHGGGESSPPGGTRLLLLDPATGKVARRRQVAEGLSFVAVVDGLVWMRRYMGTFEAFDVATLERRKSEKEVLARVPALHALVDVEDAGCFDASMSRWRFTDGSGRYVAFGFRDESIVSVPSTGCPPRANIETRSGKLPSGKELTLRDVPNGKREALFVGDRTQVGVLEFLEAHLLSGGGPDASKLLTTNGDDVFVVRRTGTRSEDPSEVVRVLLSSGTEAWAAPIDAGRTRVEQANLVGDSLLVRSGSRLSAIDTVSGAVRWHRGD